MAKKLTDKARAKLVRRLAEVEDSYDASELLNKYVDVDEDDDDYYELETRACADLLWRLVETTNLDLSQNEGLWPVLADAPDLVRPALVAELLSSLTSLTPREDRESDDGDWDDDGDSDDEDEGDEEPVYAQRDFWNSALDALAMHAYPKGPEVFAHWAEYADAPRLGFASVLVRHGQQLGDAVRCELLQTIAGNYLHDTLPEKLCTNDAGEISSVDLDETPTAEIPKGVLGTIVAPLCNADAWAAAIHEHATKVDSYLNTKTSYPAVVRASFEDLQKFFLVYSHVDVREVGYRIILDERNDSDEDLIGLSKALIEDHSRELADICLTSVVLRAGRAGREIPNEVDQDISLSGYYYSKTEPEALDLVHEAIEYLPGERRIAIFQRISQGSWSDCYHLLPLARHVNDDVLATLIDKAVADEKLHDDHAEILAELGHRPLPRLEHHWQSLPSGETREVVQLAILRCLDTQNNIDEKWDEVLGLAGYDRESYDLHKYAQRAQPALLRALAKLPAGRVHAVIRTTLEDTSNRFFTRAFAFLHLHPSPRTIAWAFEQLAKRADEVQTDHYNPWVQDSIGKLGDRCWPSLQAAMQASGSPKLAKLFEEALGKEQYEQLMVDAGAEAIQPETPLEKLQQLAARLCQSHSKTESILIGHAVDISADARPISRVGSRPFGIDESTWPRYDGERMEHVMTLDSKDIVPDQKEHVALALFISSRSDHRAYNPGNDHVAVLRIVSDDLKKGEFSEKLDEDSHPTQGIEFARVEVPSDVFLSEASGEIEELRGLIYSQPLRVWGEPIWLQGEDEEAGFDFVWQFDEELTDLNLGDGGVMYVFRDTAFFQCH